MTYWSYLCCQDFIAISAATFTALAKETIEGADTLPLKMSYAICFASLSAHSLDAIPWWPEIHIIHTEMFKVSRLSCTLLSLLYTVQIRHLQEPRTMNNHINCCSAVRQNIHNFMFPFLNSVFVILHWHLQTEYYPFNFTSGGVDISSYSTEAMYSSSSFDKRYQNGRTCPHPTWPLYTEPSVKP